MDLECPEEFLGASHDRHSQIAKGKRTKRQRPASPSGGGGGAASMGSCSSSGGGGGGGGGDASSALSPSSSGNNVVYSSAEEEEEDMANCLILLARGDGRPRQVDCHHGGSKMGIFSSKKFSEAVATAAVGGGAGATARAGFYVYECKTCSRVFPSFQALGGHRASHKKPKSTADHDQKIKPSTVVVGLDANEDEDEGQFGKISPPPLSIHMASHKGLHQVNKPNKIHECNICGSEFSSGQALGGHMRRHRSAPATATCVDPMSLTNSPLPPVVAGNEKSRNVLSLDLNLPAPAEDDHHHQVHHRRETSKFHFASSQQPLILASPALVDCHY